MGAGSVTARPVKPRAPSWKLQPPHDPLTQEIVVSGFCRLPAGQGAVPHVRGTGEWTRAGIVAGQGAWLPALADGGADHRQRWKA